LLLLILDFLYDLLLLLQFQFSILADGLVILKTVILDNNPLILLIAFELFSDFLPLPLLLLLDFPDLFLSGFDFLVVVLVLAGVESVDLEEVELVAGGHHGEFVHDIDGLRLAAFQFGQLVQRPASLFDLGLQAGQVLQLDLEIQGLRTIFHCRRNRLIIYHHILSSKFYSSLFTIQDL
jgi:hypothetical protein